MRAGDDPAGGARQHGMHRLVARCRDRHQAARGFHDHDRHIARKPQPLGRIGEELGQGGEIALHHRQQIGVQHDRAGALVFAEFGEDIGRDADRDAGQFGRKNRAGTPLMLGIGVGMQEADCDGLDTIGPQPLGDPA